MRMQEGGGRGSAERALVIGVFSVGAAMICPEGIQYVGLISETRLVPQQGNTDPSKHPVQKNVPLPAPACCMGEIIQFDSRHDAQGTWIAHDKIQVFLGNPPARPQAPLGVRTRDHVSQSDFDE